MKLSEIVASITELKQTLASFIGDKAKATTEALASFSTKLTALETGTTAELSAKSAELIEANTKISTLTAERDSYKSAFTAVESALNTACGEFKLTVKEGANPVEMVTSLKDGVASTLAKMNISAAVIPAAKPAAAAAEGSVKSRAEFEQFTPAARMAFIKAGGKLTD